MISTQIETRQSSVSRSTDRMVSIKQIYENAVIRELRNSSSTPFRVPKESTSVKHHNLLSTLLKGQIPEAPSP